MNAPDVIESWRRALDAFGDALADEGEERYFSAAELKQLEQRLAVDRRWLRRFALICGLPETRPRRGVA
jgi:hypothetical protein